jgi:hypothetical protein
VGAVFELVSPSGKVLLHVPDLNWAKLPP